MPCIVTWDKTSTLKAMTLSKREFSCKQAYLLLVDKAGCVLSKGFRDGFCNLWISCLLIAYESLVQKEQ